MDRNVTIITDLEGKKIVLINDVRFALPVYDQNSEEILRYNIFYARMLVRYSEDGKKYLYDLLAIKKEMSSPLE